MANCADCGQNPKRGCLPTCPRDKTRSIWARYRARKKAREIAEGVRYAGIGTMEMKPRA